MRESRGACCDASEPPEEEIGFTLEEVFRVWVGKTCTAWVRPSTDSSAGVRSTPAAGSASFFRRLTVAASKNAATCPLQSHSLKVA